MKNISYIGIGSNLGDKCTNCTLAIEQIIKSESNRLLEQSSFYLTEPWGYQEQDDFINLAVKIRTSLSPFKLLAYLQEIERKFSKEVTVCWGPRIIDLDILFYNDEIISSPQLTIPHPHICQRRFVLVPLHEIDPHLVHPVNHLKISKLLDDLDDSSRITRLDREPM